MWLLLDVEFVNSVNVRHYRVVSPQEHTNCQKFKVAAGPSFQQPQFIGKFQLYNLPRVKQAGRYVQAAFLDLDLDLDLDF